MAKPKWKDARDKRDSGGFIAVPLAVLNSRAYCEASAYAKALLWDMSAQLRADNNGDLACPWKLMKDRGWRSEETLHKAKRELLERGLIFETRKGARPNKASLYAVTWLALEHCGGKLDVTSASFPRGAYKFMDNPPAPARKNASLTTPAVVGEATTTTPPVAMRCIFHTPPTTPPVVLSRNTIYPGAIGERINHV